MRAALDELQTELTAAIADMRRAIFALRPVDLEALGFFPALTKLVADFRDHNQLAARLELSGPPDSLPASYELPLFRIVQHGLYNIGLQRPREFCAGASYGGSVWRRGALVAR